MTNWLHVPFPKIGLHGIVISLRDSFHGEAPDLSCFYHLSSLIGAGNVQRRSPNSQSLPA